MWSDAGTPYLDMYIRDSLPRRNRKYGRNKDVIHHETCPCCGRKLVNLYLGDAKKFKGETLIATCKEWKCKACWDKANEKQETLLKGEQL
jgi:hypothetical protein